MFTVGNSRLQQVTKWLQWVTAGFNRLSCRYSGLQQFTVGCRVFTAGYSKLQQVTEWLLWVTAGYSRLPCGYSGLQ